MVFARACVILAMCILPWTSAGAAQSATQPSLAPTRIDAADAPTIDGDISDPIWAEAAVADRFYQREPDPGAPATERTVLRVMYDDGNLYFAVHAYDATPENIVVRAMSRDGELDTGDFITIVLDPGSTRRDAYAFQVGPSGGRGDALYLNNAEDLPAWDAIWQARARRVADGWMAEIAIPFQSLSYDDAGGDWGFEFTRGIRHKNEEVRWSSTNPALEDTDVSQAGVLTGISGVRRGIGLDVQLYGVMRTERDWQAPQQKTSLAFTGGGNAFYKITPALTGTLTLHPDFSDAPLDLRQVNTSRFSLFFPETRDFFLQDAAAFEFGGLNFSGDNRETNNGRPFFSRNLGLVDGMPVGIVGGAKLSGEYGGFGIGALSVMTDRYASTDRQVLSALRMTRPVFGESRLGFILVDGDPTGAAKNTVAGADFQYRNSRLFGDSVLIADLFYERSFSDAIRDDDAFGATIDFPNEPWNGRLRFKEIGRDFNPALGFVNRSAIRFYEADAGYLFRFQDSLLRTLEIGAENTLFTDLNGRPESRESKISVDVQTDATDEFELGIADVFEDVPEAFDLPRGIIVPQGRYRWTNIEARFESSDGRALGVEIEVSCCGFYNGIAVETSIQFSYRPNAVFEIAPSYEGSFIDLPTGAVDIHVLAGEGIVNFTPDMQLALQVQYDNISENLGFLGRYRWEYQPGGELFIALGQSALIRRGGLIAQTTELSVRLGHTFRF
jgi:hypothetical protein